MITKAAVLVGSLALSIGGLIAALPSWHAAVTPASVGGIAMSVGGVLLAWCGQSPITPKVK